MVTGHPGVIRSGGEKMSWSWSVIIQTWMVMKRGDGGDLVMLGITPAGVRWAGLRDT